MSPPAERGGYHERDTAPGRIIRPRPPRLMRWLRHALIVGCVTVVLLGAFNVALAVVALVGSAMEDISRPPLCSDLPNDFDEAREVFTSRLHERFPLGLPARDVEAELAAQGFSPILPSSGRLNPGARYVVHGVTLEVWCEVRWTTDARGKITSLRPLFLETSR